AYSKAYTEGYVRKLAPTIIITTAEQISGILHDFEKDREHFVWIYGHDIINSRITQSVLDNLIDNVPIPTKPMYRLREEDQQEDLQIVVDYLRTTSRASGLFRAYCGYGKTLVMSRICAELNYKTVVIVVPFIALLEQTMRVFNDYLYGL